MYIQISDCAVTTLDSISDDAQKFWRKTNNNNNNKETFIFIKCIHFNEMKFKCNLIKKRN